MQYYLVSSCRYPNKLFSVVPVSYSDSGMPVIHDPIIEIGLNLMKKRDIPLYEIGITRKKTVELSIGSQGYYNLELLSRLEAKSLIQQYGKQQ